MISNSNVLTTRIGLMKKKRRKKASEAAGVKSTWPESGNRGNPQQNQAGDDPPYNFGGLPDRDIKKNLGCG